MERKIFKIAIIAMLLVCVCATLVSALSFSVTMTPSKKVVPASTEFTVEIKVSNLDVGTNGINTLSGNLIYDDEVFETIGESSIEGRNGWSHSFNPENDGKITLTKMSFVKTDEEVFQVTFKTKAQEELKTTKGLIQFKGISASNSASEITASDVSVEITIGEEDSSNNGNVNVTPNNTTNNNNNNNNNNNKNTTNTSGNSIGITPSNTNKNTTNTNKVNTNTNKANTNTNTNKATNTNKNTNKEVSPYVNSTNTTNEDIPYAGAEDYILYFIGAVVAIAIVFYIKFERINKEMK